MRRAAVGLWGVMLFSPCARAVPIDFSDKLENGLLCRSQWSTDYWQAYFNKALNKPLRDWGDARWWSAQSAQVGGVSLEEVFTDLGDDRVLMLGALIGQAVEQAKPAIEGRLHVTFKPVKAADGTRYVTDTLSVLVPTVDGKTKWYCAKWNMGNTP